MGDIKQKAIGAVHPEAKSFICKIPKVCPLGMKCFVLLASSSHCPAQQAHLPQSQKQGTSSCPFP